MKKRKKEELLKIYCLQFPSIFFSQSPVFKHFFNDFTPYKKTIYSVRQFESIPVLISEHPGYIHRLRIDEREKTIETIAGFLNKNILD